MSPVQKLHLESDPRSPARGLLTAVGEGREQGRHCIVTIALIGHSRASGAGGGGNGTCGGSDIGAET